MTPVVRNQVQRVSGRTTSMATTDEIRRRVEDADTARSARRSAAAQRIGELARRRAAIAEQLDDIERQLGDVLADARDVIDVDELARFTDVPPADLTRWLTSRKTTRVKRKRLATTTSAAPNATGRGGGATSAPAPDRNTVSPEIALPPGGAPAPTGVHAT